MKRFNVNVVVNKTIYTSLFTSAIVLFISGFAFTPAALAAELVINGGFEEPVVTSPRTGRPILGKTTPLALRLAQRVTQPVTMARWFPGGT